MAATETTKGSTLNPSPAHDPISFLATQQSHNESITTSSLHPPTSLEAPSPSSAPIPSPKKSFHFKLTILSLCIVTIAGSMDAVIVAACLSAIADDLGGNSVESFWIGTSFLLTQTVTIPIYGTLSDVFGRKWLVLGAVGVFLTGSVLCATAESMEWLIAARVVCLVLILGFGGLREGELLIGDMKYRFKGLGLEGR
jgi:Major Facilitator Superfamily